jgi:biopolymer transport protein ExbD
MLLPGYDAEERAFRAQLERTYVLTLLGVFTVVLLWIWMVAPLLAPGVWPLLELPQAWTGRKAPATERDVYVSVDARGQLFFNERPVTTSALASHLHALTLSAVRAESAQQVFVRVDKAAPFRAVRKVVIAAQRADQRHLVFLARAPESEMFILWE